MMTKQAYCALVIVPAARLSVRFSSGTPPIIKAAFCTPDDRSRSSRRRVPLPYNASSSRPAQAAQQMHQRDAGDRHLEHGGVREVGQA